MSIISIVLGPPGLVDVVPGLIYINTDDDVATITTPGYLDGVVGKYGDIFNDQQAANVATTTGPVWMKVVISGNDFSLVTVDSPGSVSLPVVAGHFANFEDSSGLMHDAGFLPSNAAKTIVPMMTGAVIANHIATFTDTSGTLGKDAATAINGGSIQAGLSGTAGTLVSFPASGSKGSLIIQAVANSGNTNVTINNAVMGQATVLTIPDPGATTASFILSGNGSTQHITTGSLEVDKGNVIAGSSGNTGYLASFSATGSKGSLRVQGVANTGDTVTTISNAAMGQASVISIPDPGASTANFVLSAFPAGQTIASSSASATPGTIRALIGSMTESNAVMTSGNIVGVRGVVNCVGASGGFIYGIQGKIIATGTLSGSVWNAGVFGQFDISAATVTDGQLATLWGDYGATATAGTYTGARGIAMTNTTAAILNAQIYLYGAATNLLELNDNNGLSGPTYITDGGAGAPSGTVKKLAITLNGSTYYLVASTVVS